MKYVKWTLLYISTLVICSCNKNFLNTVPQDFVSPDNYLTNDAQAEILVNGIYNSLAFSGTTDENQKMYPYHFSTTTDESFDSQPWHNSTEWARGQGNPNSPYAQWEWTRNYQGIARANVFLDGMAKASYTSANKKRYIAEGKFLRAWFYHDLVNFYGDVPLVLIPGDLSNSEPARTPKKDVIAQILKDLDEAIPDLPAQYTDNADNGRITEGAAMAFKARVLLYDGQWQAAAEAAKSVMDLGIYVLFPDYQGLFLQKNKSLNKEAIMQIFYTQNTNPSYVYYPFGVYPDFAPTLQQVNSYYMSNGLPISNPQAGYDPQNPFMNRDPRFKASIFYPGCQYVNYMIQAPDPSISKDSIVIPEWLLNESGFRVKKIFDGTLTNINLEGINTILIRYAEVLLTYAEAQNEYAGPSPDVYNAMDQLRQRAGMATLSQAMPGLSQDSMRQVIRNERRVELAFEGLRWADIRRWKIAENVMVDAIGLDPTKLVTFPGDGLGTNSNWQYQPVVIDHRSFNATRDYLWPIPQTEMDANPNMVQNPGY